MTELQERCRRCDGLLKSDNPGSITQWMNLCRCGLGQEPVAAQDALCAECGKLISANRPGTMTQWIFSSNRCQCSAREPRMIGEGGPLALAVKGGNGEPGSQTAEPEREMKP